MAAPYLFSTKVGREHFRVYKEIHLQHYYTVFFIHQTAFLKVHCIVVLKC